MRMVYLSLIILSTAFFLLIPSLTAHAIWIASRFLNQHINECKIVMRSFYVNSENGFVIVRHEPGLKEEVIIPEYNIRRSNEYDKILNNYVCFITLTYYYEGEFWGFVSNPPNPAERGWFLGWVPMNKLVLLYDAISFVEEYEHEFYPYNGNYEELKTPEKIVLWQWPGSGRKRGIERTIEEIKNVEISHVYMDKEGREWGYIKRIFKKGEIIRLGIDSEKYNYTDGWICISDPANDAIPAFNPPKPPVENYKLDKEATKATHILISGEKTFIADMTAENENEWIGFTASLRFRGPKRVIIKRESVGGGPIQRPSRSFYTMREHGDVNRMHELWQWLYNELKDTANPERFKIPYAFAFDLTTEEHALCEAKPDEILNIIQGKEAVLTWITPEVKWGEKLRIRYLQDYLNLLKENGYVEWAEIIKNIEGGDYLNLNFEQ